MLAMPRAVLDVVADEVARTLRYKSRGVITAAVLGGYAFGVLAAAGGLVAAGVRIGRKRKP